MYKEFSLRINSSKDYKYQNTVYKFQANKLFFLNKKDSVIYNCNLFIMIIVYARLFHLDPLETWPFLGSEIKKKKKNAKVEKVMSPVEFLFPKKN